MNRITILLLALLLLLPINAFAEFYAPWRYTSQDEITTINAGYYGEYDFDNSILTIHWQNAIPETEEGVYEVTLFDSEDTTIETIETAYNEYSCSFSVPPGLYYFSVERITDRAHVYSHKGSFYIALIRKAAAYKWSNAECPVRVFVKTEPGFIFDHYTDYAVDSNVIFFFSYDATSYTTLISMCEDDEGNPKFSKLGTMTIARSVLPPYLNPDNIELLY